MRSVELFAGAGGLAIASAMCGIEHAALVEWNPNACDTIRKNQSRRHCHFKDTEVIEGDVRHVDFRHFRNNVELVTGGPPCQPFSIGGKHRGFNDNRDMFPQAVRAVREIRPKAFVFENVRGLLRPSFENYFTYCLHQLRHPNVRRQGDEEWTQHLERLEQTHMQGRSRGLRYNVTHHLFDAADYGVPQRRHRVLIVGVRSDVGVQFSFPQPTHSEDRLLHDQWVTGDYWEEHEIKKPKMPEQLRKRAQRISQELPEFMLPRWRTVRDAIRDLPKLATGERCNTFANHYLNPGAKIYPGHNGSPLDLPAKALKAGDHGVPGGENMLRRKNGTVRYFSVRECARIQTFPDDWVFEGSWTESMRQLGNAVPVKLAHATVSKLVDEINQAEQYKEDHTTKQMADLLKTRLAKEVGKS